MMALPTACHPEAANPILLVEDHVMTKALRTHALSRSAPQAGPRKTAASTPKPPSMATVARRLAALFAADMPWLRKDVDLTPPNGGPEVCGPAVAPRHGKGQSAGSGAARAKERAIIARSKPK
jgi:hypothetical protein